MQMHAPFLYKGKAAQSMKNINPNDAVFSSDKFLSDKVNFNIMFRLLQYEDAFIKAYKDSIIAVQTSPDRAMWIWNEQGADAFALDKAAELAENRLNEYGLLDVQCKNELAEVLKRRLAGFITACGGSNAYACKKVNIINAPGYIDRARIDEANILAVYVSQMDEDIYGNIVNPRSLLPEMGKWINDPDFYIWRDEDTSITAMAKMNYTDGGMVRINSVFTRRDKRGRGFAPALVSRLCDKAIKEGLLPMLYADSEYPSSNRAYQKIGFTKEGYTAKLSLKK